MARIGYLDGLRGLAALTVFLVHFTEMFLWNSNSVVPPASTLSSWVTGTGNLAVCVFFTLSGFVLTYKFYATKDASILGFSAIRRYFRLVPVVLASMLLVIVLTVASLAFLGAVGVAAASIPNFAYSAGVTLSSAASMAWYGIAGVFLSDAGFAHNPVLWTIDIEFIGSLLVFGFAALTYRYKRRWLVYVAAAPLLIGSYYLPFLLGLLASDYVNNPDDFDSLFLVLLVPSVFVAASVYGDAFDVLWHSVLAALILYSTLTLGPLQAAFSTWPARFLGRVSYSFYAIGTPVLWTLAAFLLYFLPANTLSAGVALAASLLVALGVAELFTRWVDEPGIRYSKVAAEWFYGGPTSG